MHNKSKIYHLPFFFLLQSSHWSRDSSPHILLFLSLPIYLPLGTFTAACVLPYPDYHTSPCFDAAHCYNINYFCMHWWLCASLPFRSIQTLFCPMQGVASGPTKGARQHQLHFVSNHLDNHNETDFLQLKFSSIWGLTIQYAWLVVASSVPGCQNSSQPDATRFCVVLTHLTFTFHLVCLRALSWAPRSSLSANYVRMETISLFAQCATTLCSLRPSCYPLPAKAFTSIWSNPREVTTT